MHGSVNTGHCTGCPAEQAVFLQLSAASLELASQLYTFPCTEFTTLHLPLHWLHYCAASLTVASLLCSFPCTRFTTVQIPLHWFHYCAASIALVSLLCSLHCTGFTTVQPPLHWLHYCAASLALDLLLWSFPCTAFTPQGFPAPRRSQETVAVIDRLSTHLRSNFWPQLGELGQSAVS